MIKTYKLFKQTFGILYWETLYFIFWMIKKKGVFQMAGLNHKDVDILQELQDEIQ